jgi:hypothetical protein
MCFRTRYGMCGAAPLGSLQLGSIDGAPNAIRVTGAWNETWTPRTLSVIVPASR